MRELDLEKIPEEDGPLDPLQQELIRKYSLRRLRINLYRLFFGICCLFLWEVTSGRWIKELYISSPTAVLRRFVEWYASGFFFPHLAATLSEMALGFVIGGAFAILIGFIFGMKKLWAEILDPFLIALWSVPGIILGPLFILYFGIGLTPKIILVATTVFFLIFFNTLTGIRQVNSDLVNSIRLMGGSRNLYLPKSDHPFREHLDLYGFEKCGSLCHHRSGCGRDVFIYPGNRVAH